MGSVWLSCPGKQVFDENVLNRSTREQLKPPRPLPMKGYPNHCRPCCWEEERHPPSGDPTTPPTFSAPRPLGAAGPGTQGCLKTCAGGGDSGDTDTSSSIAGEGPGDTWWVTGLKGLAWFWPRAHPSHPTKV